MISKNESASRNNSGSSATDVASQDKTQDNRPVNIMFDRRIHRGNTYAQSGLPTSAARDAVEVKDEIERRRRAAAAAATATATATRRSKGGSNAGTSNNSYFDALGGTHASANAAAFFDDSRVTCEVQTELYLEELGAIPMEAQACTQTDAFIDRVPAPLYVPPRRGVDASTQIVDGELFDFSHSVAPIVDVLVGRVLERAVAELREETELAQLRRRQREYAARRAAERAEVARLAAQEQRLRDERARRMSQALALRASRDEAARRLTAVAFAATYLARLPGEALSALEQDGVVAHSAQREVASIFLPLLNLRITSKLESLALARSLVDDVILKAVDRRAQA